MVAEIDRNYCELLLLLLLTLQPYNFCTLPEHSALVQLCSCRFSISYVSRSSFSVFLVYPRSLHLPSRYTPSYYSVIELTISSIVNSLQLIYFQPSLIPQRCLPMSLVYLSLCVSPALLLALTYTPFPIDRAHGGRQSQLYVPSLDRTRIRSNASTLPSLDRHLLIPLPFLRRLAQISTVAKGNG